MDKICKIILYSKVDKSEQKELFEYLWPDLESEEGKKAQEGAIILNQQGLESYYIHWRSNLKWKVDISKLDTKLSELKLQEASRQRLANLNKENFVQKAALYKKQQIKKEE